MLVLCLGGIAWETVFVFFFCPYLAFLSFVHPIVHPRISHQRHRHRHRHRQLQDIKDFKERMALVPLRFVDREELVDLAKTEDAVFVLSADVSGVFACLFV